MRAQYRDEESRIFRVQEELSLNRDNLSLKEKSLRYDQIIQYHEEERYLLQKHDEIVLQLREKCREDLYTLWAKETIPYEEKEATFRLYISQLYEKEQDIQFQHDEEVSQLRKRYGREESRNLVNNVNTSEETVQEVLPDEEVDQYIREQDKFPAFDEEAFFEIEENLLVTEEMSY